MTTPETMGMPGASLAIWREAPSLDGLRTAALGAFSCDGPEAGERLLREACARLEAEGFARVLGPMDGDTWSKHRFVVEGDGRPPFLMEPENPAHYPAAFDAAGFTVVARYFSAEGPNGVPAHDGARPSGLRIRNFDPAKAEDELRSLHAFGLEAFAQNAFFVPISFEKFLALYRPILPRMDPELIFMADDEAGRLRAFVFAVPDWNEGSNPRSVIVKTYASRVKGAGWMLGHAFFDRFREKGFMRVIRALHHDENISAKYTLDIGGKVFRRYALWGRKLVA